MENKTRTEREYVLAQRAAFRDGTRHSRDCRDLDECAAGLYPLPKVTRPRVVRDVYNNAREWRCIDGRIETRICEANEYTWWKDANAVSTDRPGWTPDRVRLIADLLANPTETVEVDDD